MEPLHPGDLCVVKGAAGVDIPHPFAYVIGRTVICLGIAELPPLPWVPAYAPFWRCSGLPEHWAISHILLRKIPPEEMLDARMHDEPVVEPHPTEEDVLV